MEDSGKITLVFFFFFKGERRGISLLTTSEKRIIRIRQSLTEGSGKFHRDTT